jgi:hypothetical protein
MADFDDTVLRIVIETIVDSTWSAEEREWERIENLPSEDITTLIQAIKAKPRRPITPEEVVASTKIYEHDIEEARQHFVTKSCLKQEAARNEEEVELTLAEIDAHPLNKEEFGYESIAAFKAHHAQRGQPVLSTNKNLVSMRRGVPSVRRLTQEEVEARCAAVEVEIKADEEKLKQQIEDVQKTIATLPTRTVSTITDDEREKKYRLYRILDSRPYTR